MKENIKSLIQQARTDKDNKARREAIIALGYEPDPEIYTVLLELLEDPANPIRHAAVISLGRYGNPSAVSELAKPKIFRSPISDIRWAAVSAIGQLGDFHSIEILAKAVEDSEWVVRDQAVNGLKRIIAEIIRKKESRAAQMLVYMLDLDNAEIVDMVVEGLAAMSKKNTELLLHAVRASSPKMRASAAKALGVVGNSSAVPHVIPLLSDPDWRVRKNAVQALARLGDEKVLEAVVPMIEDNATKVQLQASQALADFKALAVEPILNALQHVPNKYVQRALILTLGEIGDPRAVSTLVRHLRSTYFVVRTAAVKSIVRFGSQAIPPLVSSLSFNRSDIRPLLKDASRFSDQPSQLRAIRALGALEDHRAVDILKRVAEKGESEPSGSAEKALFRIGTAAWGRCTALICLREIGHDSALPHILNSFKDPSTNVRLEAVRALAKFRGPKTFPPLMKLIRDEKDPYLRAEAIGVIRQTGEAHPRFVDLALACLKDADWTVRSQAAGLLGNLRKPKAVPALMSMLDDPHWSVQESAENALHNFGAKALPYLVKALKDRSASVRYRAARLIGEVARPDALMALEATAEKKGETQEVIRAAREAAEKIRERNPEVF